ncbi:MAG: hypothetical protein FJ304_03310 [Planctomycetes bacterium]|nr:hypothetical protein [Planctomycetota bacterium]
MCSPVRCAVLALALVPFARAADPVDIDQHEEKCVVRAAERAMERAARAAKNDRVQWAKDLEATFPGKVTNPTTEEEYGAWYDLVIGRRDEWKRDDAPNAQITALFDKVTTRMELGPVPTIKRDEFMKYARRVLMRDAERQAERQAEPVPEENADADLMFRVLDKNADGDLDREEYTASLKEQRVLADADGNGRINKTEYRAYFHQKVAAKVQTLTAKAEERNRERDGKPAPKPVDKDALPDWFAKFDTDKDKQVSLFEWRDAGRPANLFREMDLDGDGLLTKTEYLRYVKLKEIEDAQKRREEGK